MGLKKMVKRLPIFAYAEAVRRGSEEQQKRAENMREAAAPVIESVRSSYERNHVAELVRTVFPGTPR